MFTKPSKTLNRPYSELFLNLRLESNPEALCLVRATLQRATEILHFREEDSRAIVRSVDEALANMIRHAYQGKAGLPIQLSCRKLWVRQRSPTPDGLEILLEDSGAAINPKQLKGRALDKIRPGGLGLYFIRESMDVVEFSRKNGKNLLRMVKYLTSTKPGGKQEGE